MNKLRQNLFAKKAWGSEITWALTDDYIAKTIEIDAGKQTSLIVYEHKEKSIIVISGELLLTYGDCCDESKALDYKLPEGWSWHIEPGKMHKYATLGKPVRFIEVSSPQLEDATVLRNADGTEVRVVTQEIKNEVNSRELKKSSLAKLKEKEYENDRS